MNNSTALNLYEAMDFCTNLHKDSMIVEIYTEEQKDEVAKIIAEDKHAYWLGGFNLGGTYFWMQSGRKVNQFIWHSGNTK